MKCVSVALAAVYQFSEAYCSLPQAASPAVVVEPAGRQQLRLRAGEGGREGG